MLHVRAVLVVWNFIFQEAKELIKKSVSLWLPKLQSADTRNVADEEFDPVEVSKHGGDVIVHVNSMRMSSYFDFIKFFDKL